MELIEFQQAAERTAARKNPKDDAEHFGLGLIGEVGELADLIKKIRFQGHPVDDEKIEEELSDILWYLATTASTFEWELEIPPLIHEVGEEKLLQIVSSLALEVAHFYFQIIMGHHNIEQQFITVTLEYSLLLSWFEKSPQELADVVNEKLKKRYPDGFDTQASIERGQ